MDRTVAIARLKEHEAELKQLDRAPLPVPLDRARRGPRGFRCRSVLRSPSGVARAFRIDGCEGRRRPNPWAQNRHHDAAQLAPGSTGADRGIGAASVLMAKPSPVPRLTDIIEAIELIRSEMTGVTLNAFESDRRKRCLAERALEIISEASRHL